MYYICLLFLISMLWHRQAIFESKWDKLPFFCWMQDLNPWFLEPNIQQTEYIYIYIYHIYIPHQIITGAVQARYITATGKVFDTSEMVKCRMGVVWGTNTEKLMTTATDPSLHKCCLWRINRLWYCDVMQTYAMTLFLPTVTGIFLSTKQLVACVFLPLSSWLSFVNQRIRSTAVSSVTMSPYCRVRKLKILTVLKLWIVIPAIHANVRQLLFAVVKAWFHRCSSHSTHGNRIPMSIRVGGALPTIVHGACICWTQICTFVLTLQGQIGILIWTNFLPYFLFPFHHESINKQQVQEALRIGSKCL